MEWERYDTLSTMQQLGIVSMSEKETRENIGHSILASRDSMTFVACSPNSLHLSS